MCHVVSCGVACVFIWWWWCVFMWWQWFVFMLSVFTWWFCVCSCGVCSHGGGGVCTVCVVRLCMCGRVRVLCVFVWRVHGVCVEVCVCGDGGVVCSGKAND